ncbi:hypothetical protein [Chryseobacterium sp. GP-SGM7]|uniref:hypothetical protein n=1 Tax=Chryseobacterium sp. GP-SGM7 TaxID=3411323 RepID=UPI003B94D912
MMEAGCWKSTIRLQVSNNFYQKEWALAHLSVLKYFQPLAKICFPQITQVFTDDCVKIE